jgi:type I restriction enzyme M protein
MCSIFNTTTNILDYKSEIWRSCDIVRGHVKQSNLPNLMMPFFALIMVESRLVRQYHIIRQELSGQSVNVKNYINEIDFSKDVPADQHQDILDTIQEDDKGYNEIILDRKMRLIDICQSSVNFEADFDMYLASFDDETRMLLGADAASDEGFLDLRSQMRTLKAKGKLFDFVSAWAKIDLTHFSNSDITDLEEHIKREWADISADTSGEQYSPSDIIDVISSICVNYVKNGETKFDPNISVYDMTCGGGNMLYGVEDNIKPLLPSHTIKTFGQEINDQLFALSKIESRFREHSTIAHGDTLLDDKLSEHDMDFIVANPPYGVDWASIKTDVLNDKFGRFMAYPSTSDGQLLFVQHAISKLKVTGKAVIVLNGSPMFSGDVNSGESEIRKWLLDNDYVEGWIQLPKSEFFNTQITTYLWILNMDKPAARKDKIILIDASEKFKKLKKSKGQKANEIDADSRQWIIDALVSFEPAEDVKVMDKWDFYYNKQKLTLIPEDSNGTLYDRLPEKTVAGEVRKAKNIPINIKKGVSTITMEDVGFARKAVFDIEDGLLSRLTYSADHGEEVIIYEGGDTIDRFDPKKAKDVDGEESAPTVKDILAMFASNATISVVNGEDRNSAIDVWSSNTADHLSRVSYNSEPMGCGEVKVKASWDAKTGAIKVAAEALPVLERDYEIIPYLPSFDDNEAGIQAFLNKWVRKRYILEDNSVGVEVNFNKVFYKPVVLRSTSEIAADIKALDADLVTLEKELWG